MQQLDLSNALGLRIANQNVLEVKIANKTVWPKLPAALAAYSFDSMGGGVITDKSGNGYNLTTNGYTQLVTGHTSNALGSVNDGTPVAYNTSLPLTLTQGTLMAWVYVRQSSAAGDEVPLIGFFTGVGGDTVLALWHSRNWGPQNTLQGNLRKDGGALYGLDVTGYQLPTMQWTHVALVYDTAADYAKVYVNGAVAAQVSGAFDGKPLDNRTVQFFAGGYGYGQHLSNTDDARVFAVALTDAQVLQAMNTPVA